MKTAIRTILLLAVLGGFGYTLFYLYNKNQEPATVYETVKPTIRTIKQQTVAAGSVTPRNEILIKPVVSGIIDELYVEPGDRVSENDRIARIKIIPDMVNLNNAQNRVKQAKIQLNNAKQDFDRNQQLYDQGVISKADFQPIEIAYDNAQLELQAAKDNLSIIQKGINSSSQEASNTIVRSTISGMVLDVPVERGFQVIEANTFNEGTTIASVADMGEMIFEGFLDEAEVGKVQEGMDISLKIGALQNKTLDAKLEHISPKGEDKNGAIQFKIKAEVLQDDSTFIRAGYSANASITLAERKDVLSISESVVEYKEGKAYVYVQQDSQMFERTPVQLGLSDGIQTEVISGIDKDAVLRGKEKR
ncbi:efflux RND transporter periplasmic adaptor subunit [Salibacter halophilus]|uniref:Efflux RND transporter periplasmic adaptor subunit n=1 Tax=Salibacter halophilus TaxID=1803916 RepID=A0A6N6M7V4_9FLAO|nr:efflux RND transporter periplasmic adaptor subunit [Salibacter halophilus]KAB1064327.1 efflux RND transporter periplasmic adaptor subunit [Salibacter halophilus]